MTVEKKALNEWMQVRAFRLGEAALLLSMSFVLSVSAEECIYPEFTSNPYSYSNPIKEMDLYNKCTQRNLERQSERARQQLEQHNSQLWQQIQQQFNTPLSLPAPAPQAYPVYFNPGTRQFIVYGQKFDSTDREALLRSETLLDQPAPQGYTAPTVPGLSPVDTISYREMIGRIRFGN